MYYQTDVATHLCMSDSMTEGNAIKQKQQCICNKKMYNHSKYGATFSGTLEREIARVKPIFTGNQC
jgi:hypothetical protein